MSLWYSGNPAAMSMVGPEHGVRLEDVLGDDVVGAGPVGVEEIRALELYRAYIVDQRVEPHVRDVVPVEGQGNTPLQPALGPGDAQVFQGLPQERQHLRAVPLRRDEAGVLVDVLDQAVLVLAHAEEVVLLLDVGGRGLVVRALAVLQLLLGVETLAAVAVVTAVLPEIDVAGIVDVLQDPADRRLVVVVRGADEVIVGDAAGVPGGPEQRADPVRIRLGLGVVRGRRLSDLVAVLVRAGEQIDVLAPHAVVALQRVRDDGGVGVPEVRLGVHVVERRGEI